MVASLPEPEHTKIAPTGAILGFALYAHEALAPVNHETQDGVSRGDMKKEVGQGS